MARQTARQAKRDRKREHKGKPQQREDELVTLLWAYDRMVGVRNVILQRLAGQLTDAERELLAADPVCPFDYEQAAADLAAFYASLDREPVAP